MATTHNPDIHGYLACILNEAGRPVGTGFQVAPGWVVTTSHVVELVRHEHPGSSLWIATFAPGAGAQPAEVAKLSPPADLALLKTARPLSDASVRLASTDVAETTPVVIHGAVATPDPPGPSSSLTTGHFEGQATLDSTTSLLHIRGTVLPPGMAGAPVFRLSDGDLVGVLTTQITSSGEGLTPSTAAGVPVGHVRELLHGSVDPELQLGFNFEPEPLGIAPTDAALQSLAPVLNDPALTGFLLAVAIYREPITSAGLLFQLGTPDASADNKLEREHFDDEIRGYLDEQEPGELAPQVLSRVQRLIERRPLPHPPLRTTVDLQQLSQRAIDAKLVSTLGEREDGTRLTTTWTTANALQHALLTQGESDTWKQAHLHAAAFWRWRVAVWPQDRSRDVHDLCEARFHLLSSGDVDGAISVTEQACTALDTLGAWDAERALLSDLVRRLPIDHPRTLGYLRQLGIIAQNQGDYPGAEELYQQSLEIAERVGDPSGLASSYHQLGVLSQYQGKFDEAEVLYRRALEISEDMGNESALVAGYGQLGILAQLRGDHRQAEHFYRLSLRVSERIGNRTQSASSYHQLGILALDQGNYVEAERLFRCSLEISERLGDQMRIAATFHQLGMIAQSQFELDDAEKLYSQSLAISERMGDQSAMAATYGQLGILAQHRGDLDGAERLFIQSLEISQRLGDLGRMGATYYQLGILAHESDDYSTAAGRYQRALNIFEQIGDANNRAKLLVRMGSLYSAYGDDRSALHSYLEALLAGSTDSRIAMSSLGDLKALQDRVGPHVFDTLLEEVVDDSESIDALRDLLDSFSQAADEEARPSGSHERR